MEYKLVKANDNDIEKLNKYKKNIILEYANNLSKEEVNEINNYVINELSNDFNNYMNIIINHKVIGCLLVKNYNDGVLLDEIYLEKEYRNKGIGTDILKNIIINNRIVYLWVYKLNDKAINLYKKLGFKLIDETNTRYFMKYEKAK